MNEYDDSRIDVAAPAVVGAKVNESRSVSSSSRLDVASSPFVATIPPIIHAAHTAIRHHRPTATEPWES